MPTIKKAPKRKYTKKQAPAKRAYTRRASRIEVAEPVQNKSSAIKLVEGLPMNKMKATPDEQDEILAYLTNLQPNKQHLVIPLRLKSAVLRIATNNFPEYKMRTSLNKPKGTVAVWRAK